jgi:FkbH-like protein
MIDATQRTRLRYRDAVAGQRELVTSGAAPTLRIHVGGNCNVDFMVPGLRVQLDLEGIVGEIKIADHGAWIHETFSAPDADVWVIWLSAMGATRGRTTRLGLDVAAIWAAVGRLMDRGARVFVILPEPLVSEDDPFSLFGSWRRGQLDELAASMPSGVVSVSVDHLVRKHGTDAWNADRYWEQAKAPCHPDASTDVGVEVATCIARSIVPRVRAIAVDLDDTIWGGLVGEVGPQGLQLDPDGGGRPFLELQRFLVDLSDNGVPIGIVSKNDERPARLAFEERTEMILGLSSIVRFDVSWRPKYIAIAAFAEQLNIGIDSVCFLDDSKFERDEAQQMLPGLIVPDLSMPPDKRVAHLVRSKLFLNPSVSDEDRLRVAFFQRETMPAETDLQSYLEGLEMQLVATPIGTDNIDRAAALLQKTNQFNLTLWRPSTTDLRALVGQSSTFSYTYRLSDRHGDAGVIAVVVARIVDGVAEISNWVVSCRVFSRGVEWAIAEHIRSWLEVNAVEDIECTFVHGPRNSVVAGLLSDLGFEDGGLTDGGHLYKAKSIHVPPHRITIGE